MALRRRALRSLAPAERGHHRRVTSLQCWIVDELLYCYSGGVRSGDTSSRQGGGTAGIWVSFDGVAGAGCGGGGDHSGDRERGRGDWDLAQ